LLLLSVFFFYFFFYFFLVNIISIIIKHVNTYYVSERRNRSLRGFPQ